MVNVKVGKYIMGKISFSHWHKVLRENNSEWLPLLSFPLQFCWQKLFSSRVEKADVQDVVICNVVWTYAWKLKRERKLIINTNQNTPQYISIVFYIEPNSNQSLNHTTIIERLFITYIIKHLAKLCHPHQNAFNKICLQISVQKIGLHEIVVARTLISHVANICWRES